VVIPLTKEIKYKDNTTKTELKYEWHYVLKKSKYNQLNYDSAVQCEDIRSVSKARMGKYICSIDTTDLDEIKKRLKKALQV
jgi:mRNA interferase MazF